jgi:hypothetical protein
MITVILLVAIWLLANAAIVIALTPTVSRNAKPSSGDRRNIAQSKGGFLP